MGSQSGQSELIILGNQVSQLTTKLQHLYDVQSAVESPEVIECEQALQDSLDELNTKATYRLRWWQNLIMTPADSAAIRVAIEWEIFSYIPNTLTVSASELATLAKIEESSLLRVMRLLALNDIFTEVDEKFFAHTPLSAAIKESAVAKGSGFLFQMFCKPSASLADVIGRATPGKTAWEAAYGAPVYQHFENNPQHREQFGKALAILAGPDLEDLVTSVPWESFNTIVDVGGGAGHVAIRLAQAYSHLTIINQDLPGVIDDCKLALKSQRLGAEKNSISQRIEYEPHDYFVPQTRTDADCFLLRQCLHNNSDDDCISILRALVPGLCRSTSRLLINETVMIAWDSKLRQEAKRLRRKDLMAMTIGAKERTQQDFLGLLKSADKRYEIDHVYSGLGDLRVISVKLDLSPTI